MAIQHNVGRKFGVLIRGTSVPAADVSKESDGGTCLSQQIVFLESSLCVQTRGRRVRAEVCCGPLECPKECDALQFTSM